MSKCIHCTSEADGVDGKCMFHSREDLDLDSLELIDSMVRVFWHLCEQCNGVSAFMGQLGNVLHYRCRDCGWTQSKRTIDISTH